jgi:acylphosphatase
LPEQPFPERHLSGLLSYNGAMNTAVTTRRTCYFSGNVQGVGFRYTVQNLALRHDVRGYVRNTSDGRVELVMEGPERDMDSLLAEIRQKMNGYIDDVSVNDSPATGEFQRFSIKQ